MEDTDKVLDDVQKIEDNFLEVADNADYNSFWSNYCSGHSRSCNIVVAIVHTRDLINKMSRVNTPDSGG